MKTKKIVLVTLMLMGLNVCVYAQENAEEYRAAVIELIKANRETKSCPVLAVAGSSLMNRSWYSESDDAFVLAWVSLQKEVKTRLWNTYQEKQFIDDQTDIFVKTCKKQFGLSAVKKLTDDLPVIKNVAMFTESKPIILQNFGRYIRPYVKGELQGVEAPECSEAYKQLSEQFYTLLGMQKMFDQDMKVYVGQPSFAWYIEEVKTFYAENERVFFLRICHENLSEADLKACVEYLSAKPALYIELDNLSEKKHKEISKMCWDKFVEWMKRDEPDVYNALKDWQKDMRF